MDATIENTSFSITSSVFANHEPIPPLYTCKGQNMRPPLSIDKVPDGTQSLAIVMSDPDAVNGEWTHWTIWNISPMTLNIDERTLPQGVTEGITSFGKPGYGGPCPPQGTGAHRYIFELYALDTMLDLTAETDPAHLREAMKNHVLEKARLVGSFEAD